jgi:hypothetical protein
MFMADVIVGGLMMKTFKSKMMLRGGRGFATRKCRSFLRARLYWEWDSVNVVTSVHATSFGNSKTTPSVVT